MKQQEDPEGHCGGRRGAGQSSGPAAWCAEIGSFSRRHCQRDRHRCGGTPDTPDPSLTGTQVSVECDRCRDVVSFALLEEEARKGEFFGRKSARVRMVCAEALSGEC